MTLNIEALNQRLAWICQPESSGRREGTLENPAHDQSTWGRMRVGAENPTAVLGQNFCHTAFCLAGDQVLNDPGLVFVVQVQDTSGASDVGFWASPEYAMAKPVGYEGELLVATEGEMSDIIGDPGADFSSIADHGARSLGLDGVEAREMFSSSRSAQDLVDLAVAVALRHGVLDRLVIPGGWRFYRDDVKSWLWAIDLMAAERIEELMAVLPVEEAAV